MGIVGTFRLGLQYSPYVIWLCENKRLSAILSIYELFVINLSELIFFVQRSSINATKWNVIGYLIFFFLSFQFRKNQAKDLDFFSPPIPSVNYVFHASISNKTSRLMKKVCDSLIDWWKKISSLATWFSMAK